MSETVEIIEPRWLVTVEPDAHAHENRSVAIQADSIVEVLSREEARSRYPAARIRSLPDHVLIPGLINLHTHAAMTLMRGLADDLPLMRWLQEHIWPTEAKHVSAEFVYDGTLLACLESIRGGVTHFNDMYFFPEMAARAVLDSGLRATLGIIVIEFPSAYATDAQSYLEKGLATRDQFKDESRLTFTLAPHAPYTVKDKTFERVLTLAEQLELPITMHVHETTEEIHQSISEHGVRPIDRLRQLGMIGPNLISVHSVHLTEEEVDLYVQFGCSVAHCPASNMKLASGIAPIAALDQAGVTIGIGTDGTASNNRLDMFEEMRLAALLAKVSSGAADAVPAHRALTMATLGGARALGLESVIGSIKPGKRADLTAVNLSALELSPCYDPVSHLVYAASRHDVTHVWIDGQLLLQDGTFTKIDPAVAHSRVDSWQRKIQPTQ